MGAKCIAFHVLALPEGSNSVQCFERKYSLKAKQVAPLTDCYHTVSWYTTSCKWTLQTIAYIPNFSKSQTQHVQNRFGSQCVQVVIPASHHLRLISDISILFFLFLLLFIQNRTHTDTRTHTLGHTHTHTHTELTSSMIHIHTSTHYY